MNISGALQAFATLAWLVVVGAVVLAVIQASRNRAYKGTLSVILIAAIAAVILTSLAASIVFIQPEERGMVISALQPRGYREQALEPGMRLVVPFFEYVIRYPISSQTYTMSIAPAEGQVQGDDSVAARTSDGQEIFVDASVLYAIDPTRVTQVHIEWQSRYANDLVRPLSRGIIRDMVAKFGVEEVYSSRRLDMTEQIRTEMTKKLSENGLILVDFILRNITFSPEYAASVEQKQIAEQQAQQAVFVVEQRKQEALQAMETARGQAESLRINAQGRADSRLIEAEAEATALEMIANVIQDNQDMLIYNYINKLAPGIEVMLVPNNNPYLLTLPTINPAETTTPAPH